MEEKTMEGSRLQGLREIIRTRQFPMYLRSYPPDYAVKVVEEYSEENPTLDLGSRKMDNGVVVWLGADKNDPAEFSQITFTDDDVRWFLTQTKHRNIDQLVSLLGGSLSHLSFVTTALPFMDYFLKTLETGERMKKDAYICQACILTVFYHPGVVLPKAVMEYVAFDTPEYGTWTEQHVNQFYEILRSS